MCYRHCFLQSTNVYGIVFYHTHSVKRFNLFFSKWYLFHWIWKKKCVYQNQKLSQQPRFLFYLCMNVHLFVSLRVCVALCWASSKRCCCCSSALSPSCQLFLRWPLSSSNSSCRRTLCLDKKHNSRKVLFQSNIWADIFQLILFFFFQHTVKWFVSYVYKIHWLDNWVIKNCGNVCSAYHVESWSKTKLQGSVMGNLIWIPILDGVCGAWLRIWAHFYWIIYRVGMTLMYV